MKKYDVWLCLYFIIVSGSLCFWFLVQNDNGYKEIFNSNYDKKGLNIMP